MHRMQISCQIDKVNFYQMTMYMDIGHVYMS